ncbi:MAG TPA: ABC transporter ATP-binding protein, partial [Dehalococcoidia bacterium]
WYGNVVAVNDISFALAPGITGLLGPNGAGKSTLLNILCGLLKPSNGSATVMGEPSWMNPDIYSRLGYVPEKESVYPFLTGFDFVRLSARLHHLPDADAATKRAIDEVELTTDQDRPTGGYSKGMKQRIKIAAAIVHNPSILLLDEPFNGADPRQRLRMMDMLRARAREGATIIFSSHILEEVERLAENVLVVVGGRLAASGDFHAIRSLMTDRPHEVTIRSSDNRRLGAALMAEACVFGVEVVEDGRLSVRASDLIGLAHTLPRLAKGAGVSIMEMFPTDESLESVFSYLVKR